MEKTWNAYTNSEVPNHKANIKYFLMNSTIQDTLVDKNVIKIKPTITKWNKNGNE